MKPSVEAGGRAILSFVSATHNIVSYNSLPTRPETHGNRSCVGKFNDGIVWQLTCHMKACAGPYRLLLLITIKFVIKRGIAHPLAKRGITRCLASHEIQYHLLR